MTALAALLLLTVLALAGRLACGLAALWQRVPACNDDFALA
ncbi:hypothetical protein [Eleftheria terrae]|nr:hypothetical protein [Eleftheria terrae]WKB51158.1 hypothetical protein N7L95_15235 [Eleftheria terrae]